SPTGILDCTNASHKSSISNRRHDGQSNSTKQAGSRVPPSVGSFASEIKRNCGGFTWHRKQVFASSFLKLIATRYLVSKSDCRTHPITISFEPPVLDRG